MFSFCISIFCFLFVAVEGIDQVVIWGHKHPSHTHHFIHAAFYKAFLHLGYKTYWFDESDKIDQFCFDNTLFLTEGQVDKNIPLKNNCQYILHNCNSEKYYSLKVSQWIRLQVYTDAVLSREGVVKIAPYIHYGLDQRTLYMPWATDLLPYEIDEIKETLRETSFFDNMKSKIYWVGMVGEGRFGNRKQIDPFITACRENGIEFIDKKPGSITFNENVALIQQSYSAPTLAGEWQLDVGYIPCRIFKNISYGAMGVTNSRQVYELFERKIVFNTDSYQLFYDAQEHLNNFSLDDLFEQMDFVRDHHTYLNRIATLFDFFEKVENCNEEIIE